MFYAKAVIPAFEPGNADLKKEHDLSSCLITNIN